jgi:hypothetical protein
MGVQAIWIWHWAPNHCLCSLLRAQVKEYQGPDQGWTMDVHQQMNCF